MKLLKKAAALLLSLALLLTMFPAAMAEAVEFPLSELRDIDFYFSSGVGAWFTELYISEDGLFSGTFIDDDMGDSGEGYANGTEYNCVFNGKVTSATYLDDLTVLLTIDPLVLEQEPGIETLLDDVRYVSTAPYGLEKATELMLYLPGSPISDLPDTFLSWVGMALNEGETELPFWGLYSAADEAGFIGESLTADWMPQEPAAAAGGWNLIDPDYIGLADEDRAVFAKATEGWTGTQMTPVAVLATQVVAGMNYCFLCQLSTVTAQPVYYWALVYVNAGLDGSATILGVQDLPIGLN